MRLILSFITFVLGATAMANSVQIIGLDNGYKVWTKRVGHGPIKILTLHGGPGCCHDYIENAFQKVFSPEEFEIVYYDQLGSYFSDQPNDSSLWTVERFREEVEQVRKALELDHFYLYGQSWGGMLAIEYDLKYPQYLKGLILSNTPGSLKSYEAYLGELRLKLPEEVQQQMRHYESEGDFSHPEYQRLVFERVYSLHICRLNPWPDALMLSFERLNEQPYHTMQGPNEFIITGNFKNWDRWSDLSLIHVPTLVISGRYDTINPADTAKIASLIPNASFKVCENGSHLSMYDDSESYFSALFDFFQKEHYMPKELEKLAFEPSESPRS